MDIFQAFEKLQLGKNLLEIEIAEYMSQKMRLFEDTYGISPAGIEIRFQDVTNIESKRPKYIISSVNINLGSI